MRVGTILFGIFVMLLTFSSASVLISDQGTDVRERESGDLVYLGNLTILIYDSDTSETPIYNQTFPEAIVNGSWNVMIIPELEYGNHYWKDYEINGENLNFEDDDRLEFQSPVGLINNVSYINLSLISSCPEGSSIRTVNSDGSVECEDDDAGAGSPDLNNYALKNQSETFNGNVTAERGFFGWIGSITARVVKLFVQDINFNGTIDGSGNITTTGNISAAYFFGDGSGLTNLPLEESVAYTHLSNFTDNIGARGYTSLSNFTNDLEFINSTEVSEDITSAVNSLGNDSIVRNNSNAVFANVSSSLMKINSIGNNPCSNLENGTFCRNASGLYYKSGI